MVENILSIKNIITQEVEVSQLELADGLFTGLLTCNNVKFANITELKASNDLLYNNGFVAFVETLKGYFSLDKTSAQTADNISITTTNSGTGRWYRLNVKTGYWNKQSNWYINSVSGNDENDGYTSLTPIKTWSEYTRRVGINPEISNRVDIYILEDMPSTDPVILRPQIVLNGILYIHGTKTQVGAGVITGIITRNTATNTPLQITDTSMVWTSHVERFVEITGSSTPSHIGCGLWIDKDLGSNTARATTSISFNDPAASTTVLLSEISPSVGDTYSVYTLSKIAILDIRSEILNQLSKGRIIIDYIELNDASGLERSILSATGPLNGRIYPIRSKFYTNITLENITVGNCMGGNGGFYSFKSSGATVTFNGGGLRPAFNMSFTGRVILNNGFLISNPSNAVLTVPGTYSSLEINDAGVFDWIGSAFRISGGCIFLSLPGGNGLGKLWGSSSVLGAFAIDIRSGKFITNISGNSGFTISSPVSTGYDFKVRGATSGPAWDVITNTYTSNRAYTIALLKQVVGGVGGVGFDGNAIDPASGSGIMQELQ